jgi:hypothetical protein
MIRSMIVTMLLACASQATAQDRASREDPEARGRFGALVLEVTSVRDRAAVMFGGRGARNVTPSLSVGVGLYGTLAGVDAPEGAVPGVPGHFDIKMERFGMELEYAVHPTDATHLTLGSFVGGGAAHYVKDGSGEQEGETDFLFLVEPAVGVERQVTEALHLNLSASWRLAGGVEMRGLATGDLQGPTLGLAVKLGRF